MFVDAIGNVLCSDWRVVALAVDVLQCGIWLCEGLIGVLVEVECDIQEVNYLLVSFYGNAESVVFKDMAYFLLDVFCVSRCGVSGRQSVVAVKSYVNFKVLQLG